MAAKKTLNDKRLTKKQVLEIIKNEGQLHEAYTKFFEEQYASGYVKRDKVYALPGGRYLYVFDEAGLNIPGKGDIYPEDYFLKQIKWLQRVRDDYANQRGSSVEHWMFYSKHKNDIFNHTKELITELAEMLQIDKENLNATYDSLDLVSNACSRFELEWLFETIYDNLVTYVGEVIRKRVEGFWDVNTDHSGGAYPFISINIRAVQYMPVNVVWSSLGGLEPVDFRKETVNEIRSLASRVSFEKKYRKI